MKIQISTLDSTFLASFHITVLINCARLNCCIKFYLKTNNTFMPQSTHKMANLNQNEICAVLRLKRQYKQHDGEKWLCEILHIACLLSSENPIKTRTQNFIKHVLLAKVRAINRLKNTNYRTRKRQEWGGGGLMKKFLCVNEIKNTMINKIRHYLKMPYWIENSNQYPRFHVSSLFPHYCTHKLCKAKLLHKILFEDK